MKQVLLIAADEWRYWLRSHLVLGGALIFFVLVVATSILSALRLDVEKETRMLQQSEAEETFYTQPDRHPHRMVHYGHYLFRAPAPLALFDPGLDSVTGQSIFLEGHHQNTVMFAESSASADLGGLSWLNPAMIYQLFAPLVIILLGHGSIVRERESNSLTPLLAVGVSAGRLILGKVLALLFFIASLLLPLVASCVIALIDGERMATLLLLTGIYSIYLALWAILTLLVSLALEKRQLVLAIMTGLWLCFTLVLPSFAVNVATETRPIVGKIKSDLNMVADLRKLGDGHNANDPAFQKLRTDLLKKYNVERIEDLPVNFRGVVAMNAEEKLTSVMNDYANSRISAEKQQEDIIAKFGLLTPAIAIAFASRSIAGTDLEHFHRFQREAEAVRYDFIQGLNQAHVDELSYEDDINRNKDEESWQRARVDSSNWQVLEKYQFQTASISERVLSASSSILFLVLWLMVMCVSLVWCTRKLRP